MQTHAEWSPQNWREQTKARRARLGYNPAPKPALRIVSATEEPIYRTIYRYPIGPVWRDVLNVTSRVPPRFIVKKIADDCGVREEDVYGPRRHKNIIRARFLSTYAVADEYPDWSLTRLGRFFNRDHTSILSCLRKREQVEARYDAKR